MDKLPVEILQNIVTLACTDGGATGRALRLVSRYICDVSASSEYHSITVVGREQMTAFLSRVKRDERACGSVRHLFLSDSTAQARRAGLPDITWLDERGRFSKMFALVKVAAGCNRSLEYGKRARAAAEKGVNDAVHDILEHVAPTLRSLSLHMRVARRFSVVPVHLPLLEDLTLDVPSALKEHAGICAASDFHQPTETLRSLSRLHLVHDHRWGRPYMPTVPPVSHLRLSLTVADDGNRPFVASFGTVEAQLPPAIRDVVLRPVPADDRFTRPEKMPLDLGTLHTDIYELTRDMQDDDGFTDMHGDVYYHSDAESYYDLDEACEDWKDQIEGGEGCWRDAVPLKQIFHGWGQYLP